VFVLWRLRLIGLERYLVASKSSDAEGVMHHLKDRVWEVGRGTRA